MSDSELSYQMRCPPILVPLTPANLDSTIEHGGKAEPLHAPLMDCQNCELHQKRFFCANCSRNKIHEHKITFSKLLKERQAAQEQAERLLKASDVTRLHRAELVKTESHLKELAKETEIVRRANDGARTRVAALRTQLATRRANLQSARSLSNTSYGSRHPRSSVMFPEAGVDWEGSLDEVNYRLALTRKSLVDELLEAFELAETDVSTGRLGSAVAPPVVAPVSGWNATGIGRHASEFFLRPLVAKKPVEPSSLRWTIGNLVLPTPAEVQKMVKERSQQEGAPAYAIEETNAAIGCTLHFVSMISFYLGIKLPFQVQWSRRKQNVGTPFLKATSGPANGKWARWIMPCALHLSPALAPSSLDAFSIAYSMLAYNVCYLAYTQAISIPLVQSGNILANLWTICSHDKSLGRFSHHTSSNSADVVKEPATWPPVTASGVGVSHPVHHGRVLAAPTPAPTEFHLDFEAVVEHLAGRKVEPPSESLAPEGLMVEDEGGDGWAVVDIDADAM